MFQDTPVSCGGLSISSSLGSEFFDWGSDGPWHGLFLNFIFGGGQSGQDLSLGIFMSLIVIIVVVMIILPSTKLETVLGSKHECIQLIWIVNSSRVILYVRSKF